MKNIINLQFLAWLFLTASCSPASEKEASEESSGHVALTAAQMKAANIEITTLAKRNMTQAVQANGFLEVPPNERAQVNSFVQGHVHEIKVLVGNRVKKGEVLCSIVSPEFLKLQENYLEFKNQLAFLQQDFERVKRLSDENITAKKEFQGIEANYLTTKAKFESVKQTLLLMQVDLKALDTGELKGKLEIKSPLSGEISHSPVVLGSRVGAGDMLFEVVSLDHLHAELKVFERDLPYLKNGQRVTVQMQHQPNGVQSGKVYLVSHVLDEAGRFAWVHVHFDNKLQNPQVGAYLDAQIVISERELFAVEEKALLMEDNSYFVFVPKSSGESFVFEKMQVSIGERQDGFVEIVTPTGPFQYVSRGVYFLSMQ
jgi:cobalt-zinc-cadmium efflux system membrane fusion protein